MAGGGVSRVLERSPRPDLIALRERLEIRLCNVYLPVDRGADRYFKSLSRQSCFVDTAFLTRHLSGGDGELTESPGHSRNAAGHPVERIEVPHLADHAAVRRGVRRVAEGGAAEAGAARPGRGPPPPAARGAVGGEFRGAKGGGAANAGATRQARGPDLLAPYADRRDNAEA